MTYSFNKATVPGKVSERVGSLEGFYRLESGAGKSSEITRSGSIISKIVYTRSGVLITFTSIDLYKIATGVFLIGLDVYNIFSQYKSLELELNNIKSDN